MIVCFNVDADAAVDADSHTHAHAANTDKLFAMSKTDLVALAQKLIAVHREQRSASKAQATEHDQASSAASEAESAVAAAQEAAAIEKAELEAQIAEVKDEHTTATVRAWGKLVSDSSRVVSINVNVHRSSPLHL